MQLPDAFDIPRDRDMSEWAGPFPPFSSGYLSLDMIN